MGKQKNTNVDIGRCSRSTDAEEGRISLCCSLGQGFVQPLCGLEHADSDLPARVDCEVVVVTSILKLFLGFSTHPRDSFSSPRPAAPNIRPARRP